MNLTDCLWYCIDIRFKNNGLDLIEVQDNGKGISPDDYETVGMDARRTKSKNPFTMLVC